MYRGLSTLRIKQFRSVPCFRIVSSSTHRDALHACAARPNRAALCVCRAARCGERIERRRWRMKRDERVAAVKILSVRRKAARKFWAPQQGHRALRISIAKRCVGDDAYIVPPPRISCAMASLLSYLSYPIFQKMQGFPCEFFVITPTSSFFLLPNAPTCSKMNLLTVLRVKLRSRSCAMDTHESCQAGNRAALRGIIHVPQGRRLCGFMGRTILFSENSKSSFC